MTKDQATLYLIQGVIREMPQETQDAINKVAEQLRSIRSENPEGVVDMAIALIGAELAAS